MKIVLMNMSPDDFTEQEKRSNKIYKVEKYLTQVQLDMQHMHHPSYYMYLSLDEEMTTYKVKNCPVSPYTSNEGN